jgi:hypothetical protein
MRYSCCEAAVEGKMEVEGREEKLLSTLWRSPKIGDIDGLPQPHVTNLAEQQPGSVKIIVILLSGDVC